MENIKITLPQIPSFKIPLQSIGNSSGGVDKDYVNNELLQKESISNKTYLIDENSDDTHYPSAKAVYTFGNEMGRLMMGDIADDFATKLMLEEATALCATKEQLGDIETALDSIIEIQNSLIGGDGI